MVVVFQLFDLLGKSLVFLIEKVIFAGFLNVDIIITDSFFLIFQNLACHKLDLFILDTFFHHFFFRNFDLILVFLLNHTISQFLIRNFIDLFLIESEFIQEFLYSQIKTPLTF